MPPNSQYRPLHIVDRPLVMSPTVSGPSPAIGRQYSSQSFHGCPRRSQAKPIAYSFYYRQMTIAHPSEPSVYLLVLE